MFSAQPEPGVGECTNEFASEPLSQYPECYQLPKVSGRGLDDVIWQESFLVYSPPHDFEFLIKAKQAFNP